MDKLTNILKTILILLKHLFTKLINSTKNISYKFKYNIKKRNTINIMYENIIKEKKGEILNLEKEFKDLQSINYFKKDKIKKTKCDIEDKKNLLKNIQELVAR